MKKDRDLRKDQMTKAESGADDIEEEQERMFLREIRRRGGSYSWISEKAWYGESLSELK